jgi:prepilin-type N-terminal cleavage/methylation domain-containing protein
MKFGMKRNEAGFSLVELMIVVGIIGILASLAMPKMQVFMAKARQSEAKGKLANVFALQQSYFTENNTFGTIAQIGLNVTAPTATDKDVYGVPSLVGAPSATAFTAQISNIKQLCNGVAAGGDVWQVTETNALTNSTNGLAGCK